MRRESSCEHCGRPSINYALRTCEDCGSGMCFECTEEHDEHDRCPGGEAECAETGGDDE